MVACFQRFRDGSWISFPFTLSRFALINGGFHVIDRPTTPSEHWQAANILDRFNRHGRAKTDVSHVFRIRTFHYRSLKIRVLELCHSRYAQHHRTVVPKGPGFFVRTFQSRMYARLNMEAKRFNHPVDTRHIHVQTGLA